MEGPWPAGASAGTKGCCCSLAETQPLGKKDVWEGKGPWRAVSAGGERHSALQPQVLNPPTTCMRSEAASSLLVQLLEEKAANRHVDVSSGTPCAGTSALCAKLCQT